MIREEIKNNIGYDLLLFISLFILTIFSVYYAHPVINKIFFLILLVLMWFSNKNYFWICFFIIIASTPFNLFSEGGGEIVNRVPVYDFYGNFGLDFKEIFILLFLIKAYYKGKYNELTLKQEYYNILVWIIVLWMTTFIIGITFWNFIKYSRQMLYLTFFYSIPRLLDKKNIYQIYNIFALFTILYFVDQIMSVTANISLAQIIKNQEVVSRYRNFLRTSSRMILPQFFTYIFGLFYLSSEMKTVNKKFIITAMVIAYLSIFTTGTRGWIVAFTFVLIFHLVYLNEIKINKVLTGILTSGFLAVLLLFYFPVLKELLFSNIKRIGTLSKLLGGDLSAGGTLSRLTIRLPHLIEAIQKSPIIGLGFSDAFYAYNDGHVGWANQILQMGFLGLVLFFILWIRFWENNIKIFRKLSKLNPLKKSILALNTGLLCLLIIHSTSRTIFNFSMDQEIIILVIMYFLVSDIMLKIAISEENKINPKDN